MDNYSRQPILSIILIADCQPCYLPFLLLLLLSLVNLSALNQRHLIFKLIRCIKKYFASYIAEGFLQHFNVNLIVT